MLLGMWASTEAPSLRCFFLHLSRSTDSANETKTALMCYRVNTISHTIQHAVVGYDCFS